MEVLNQKTKTAIYLKFNMLMYLHKDIFGQPCAKDIHDMNKILPHHHKVLQKESTNNCRIGAYSIPNNGTLLVKLKHK